MSRPWMKFYPADWRDARLRSCSLAARGLWIDLMSYMHEAEPYGHLLIADKAPSIIEIALQLARPVNEVRKAFGELEAAGVFSKTDSGMIFSRRMVRDNERSEEGRRQIAKRWDDREPSSIPNRSYGDYPITQKLEARVKKEKEDKTADAASSSDNKYFFDGVIIKLTKKHFDDWEKAFSHLDLRGELMARTRGWLATARPIRTAKTGLSARQNTLQIATWRRVESLKKLRNFAQ